MNSFYTGRNLRDDALLTLEEKRVEWINKARAQAVAIARRAGRVTINDVRKEMELPEDYHPNTWGAVLRGSQFKAIGFDQAVHPAAHARTIRLYQLREAI